MPSTKGPPVVVAVTGLVALAMAATGCTASSAGGDSAPEQSRQASSSASSPPVSVASVEDGTRWVSTLTVDADINSVSAGKGVFGQESRSTSLTIGDAVVSKIDVAKHQMLVFRNGSLLRTLPVTAGKNGFVTRSGSGSPKDDPEYARRLLR